MQLKSKSNLKIKLFCDLQPCTMPFLFLFSTFWRVTYKGVKVKKLKKNISEIFILRTIIFIKKNNPFFWVNSLNSCRFQLCHRTSVLHLLASHAFLHQSRPIPCGNQKRSTMFRRGGRGLGLDKAHSRIWNQLLLEPNLNLGGGGRAGKASGIYVYFSLVYFCLELPLWHFLSSSLRFCSPSRRFCTGDLFATSGAHSTRGLA